MLWLGLGLVSVLVQCTWYKPRDMRVECYIFVVQLEMGSDKELDFPVHRDLIIFLEHAEEVVGMHIAYYLDSKFIYQNYECDWSPNMTPQAWRELILVVSCLD